MTTQRKFESTVPKKVEASGHRAGRKSRSLAPDVRWHAAVSRCLKRLALPSVAVEIDRGGPDWTSSHAGMVVEVLPIGAAGAGGAVCAIVANSTVVRSNRRMTLASVAGRVDAIGACKVRPALPAVVSGRHVRDQPVEAVAGVDAPVLVKELAAVATSAVLANLAGPEVADPARSGGVLIRRAFAAVGDVHATDAASIAGERRHTPTLELG